MHMMLLLDGNPTAPSCTVLCSVEMYTIFMEIYRRNLLLLLPLLNLLLNPQWSKKLTNLWCPQRLLLKLYTMEWCRQSTMERLVYAIQDVTVLVWPQKLDCPSFSMDIPGCALFYLVNVHSSIIMRWTSVISMFPTLSHASGNIQWIGCHHQVDLKQATEHCNVQKSNCEMAGSHSVALSQDAIFAASHYCEFSKRWRCLWMDRPP